MSSKHCKLSPSSAHRWMVCPASANVEESVRSRDGYVETSSIYADVGTHAHALADDCLRTGCDVFESTYPALDFEYTEKVQHHVQAYLDYVRAFVGEGDVLESETRVDYSSITYGEEGFGTLDACVYQSELHKLHIFDLKFGVGVRIDAADNPQMYLYACGAIDLFPARNVGEVILHICQPRIGNWQEVRISTQTLELFRGRVSRAVLRTKADNPDFNPGGAHCQFCKGLSSCAAFAKHAVERLQIKRDRHSATPPEIWELTTEDKTEIMSIRPVVRSFLNAVGNELQSDLRSGLCVPGYKLVAKRHTRQWADPDVAGELLQGEIGERAYVRRLISVAEAQKQTSRKFVDALTEAAPLVGADNAVIAPTSDKRKEIEFDHILNYFDEEKNEQ